MWKSFGDTDLPVASAFLIIMSNTVPEAYAYLAFIIAIGFSALGFAWGHRLSLRERLRCISLEHELAREQRRAPRDIDKIPYE